MQNYRLRELDEKIALKPIAVIAYSRAKEGVEAARRQLDSRRSIEKQHASTEDERKKAGCETLLQKFPPLDVLETNLELAKRKLNSTWRQIVQISEAEEQYEAEVRLTATIKSQFGRALEELHEKYGDIEAVYKLDESKRRLDIYFGGQDSPLGKGHAHWVYWRDYFVYQRPPKVEQAAC